MADFDAGSVLIGFKAQISEIQRGIRSVQNELQQFGRNVKSTAGGIAESSGQIADGFNEIDRNTAKATAKFAKFTNRLLSLQFAFSQLGASSQQSFSGLSKVTEAASSALSVFALTVTLLPGKLGIVIGAIGALITAFGKLAGASKEAIDSINRATATARNLEEQRLSTFEKTALRSEQLARAFGAGPFEITQEAVNRTRSRIAELDKLQVDATNRITDLRHQIQATEEGNLLGLSDKEIKALKEELNGVLALQDEFIRQRETLEDRVKPLTTLLELERSREALKQFNAQANLVGASTAEDLKRGIVTPMEEANVRFQRATQQVQELRQQIQQLELKGLGAKAGEFNTALQAAKDTQADILREQRAIMKTDELANNFSSAIGQGVKEGILSGQDSLEILANVGQNLFSNMLDQAIGQFQTGMTEAFKAVVGVGGEALSGLFTAIAGIAGAIFGQKREAQQSFNAIQNQIRSTEAVRGVVAGPQSVAIAAVGENLKRALVGVEGRLDRLIAVNTGILNKIGGTAAGEFTFAGATPTT